MACSRLMHQIQDDEYTLDIIDQQPVLVLSPLIMAKAGEWEGSLLISRNYLLNLLKLGLEYQLLSRSDLLRESSVIQRQEQEPLSQTSP